jgi:hypothetical protein
MTITFFNKDDTDIERWRGVAECPAIGDEVFITASVAEWYRVVKRSWWHHDRVKVHVVKLDG